MRSKTIVRGSEDVSPAPPDGEDRFTVYYLQDADVQHGPACRRTTDNSDEKRQSDLKLRHQADVLTVHRGIRPRLNLINTIHDSGAVIRRA